MSIHPQVQEKVVDELRSVFQSSPVEITYENLNKLVYMDMVIKETLRLVPSVPNLARKTTAEIELDGYKIAPGTDIHISPLACHRNEEQWGPNADQFDPDNFLPEKVAERHPFAWMAFSIGIRNCIGKIHHLFFISYQRKILLYNFICSTQDTNMH